MVLHPRDGVHHMRVIATPGPPDMTIGDYSLPQVVANQVRLSQKYPPPILRFCDGHVCVLFMYYIVYFLF